MLEIVSGFGLSFGPLIGGFLY